MDITCIFVYFPLQETFTWHKLSNYFQIPEPIRNPIENKCFEYPTTPLYNIGVSLNHPEFQPTGKKFIENLISYMIVVLTYMKSFLYMLGLISYTILDFLRAKLGPIFIPSNDQFLFLCATYTIIETLLGILK